MLARSPVWGFSQQLRLRPRFKRLCTGRYLPFLQFLGTGRPGQSV